MSHKATPEREHSTEQLLADRQRKLERVRDEFDADPYGRRIDGLVTLADAVARYDEQADQANRDDPETDDRPIVRVAGRVMAHRVMGNLIFMSLRDATGDMQLAVSKKLVGQPTFSIAKAVDLSDVVVAQGPLAKTKTGEITVWATKHELAVGNGESGDDTNDAPGARRRTLDAGFAIACKSLALPPGKFHGLSDAETRYRKRYVDLYANPEVMQTMLTRSRILKATRDFFCDRGFVEVETPMMQPQAGGAAARPFVTHHNALDIELFLRIAPELYLKRLLVGGMPKVFEINRNFRNEGIDRSHNPEFTMLELYEAFGDLYTVMDHTEQLFQHLVRLLKADPGLRSTQPAALSTPSPGERSDEGPDQNLTIPFGDIEVDYGSFRRARYLDLFEEHNGFPGSDHAKLLERAAKLHIEDADKKAHDVLLNEVWEETVEAHLVQPTFVIDYPASLCPLTRRKPGEPQIAERFELFICGMELANAYTELNDPAVQQANFEQQVEGIDDEEATFRAVDHDFLEALRVGMPPAGGLGIGIDRLVMLLTNHQSIRDVILFPLMRPLEGAEGPSGQGAQS